MQFENRPQGEHASDEDELTLGERVAVGKHEREAEASRAFQGAYRTNRAPESVAKRTAKGRPREISSRRPVPMGRERCLGIDDGRGHERSVRNAFDPRFEEHCGELRDEHVERNYAFVQGLREKRRQKLQQAVRGDGDGEAARELTRMEDEDARRRIVVRRRDILKKVRQEEKEAVKRGKKPFFMKEAQLRNLEIEAKFKELKESGGVKKYIEKRRKRQASKDRKLLPGRKER